METTSLLRFFHPFFLDPFEFPLKVSAQELHPMVLHFPLVLLLVAFASEALPVARLEPLRSKWFFRVGYASLLVTYVTGQISSVRKGLSLRDLAWIDSNREMAASVINHRGFALITVLLFTLIWFLRERLNPEKRTDRRIFVGAMAAGILALTVTAHLGAHLKL